MQLPTNVLIPMSLSVFLVVAGLLVLNTNARFMLHLPGFWPGQSPLPNDLQLVSQDGDVKVPVTLGVMSKCPDALLCESVFDKVIPQVENKIDLSLSFIGRLDKSVPDFGVACLHGPTECAGNVHELCAIKHLEQNQWWSFLKCLNFEGRNKIGEPDVALKCAETANFDWMSSGVGACAGEDGSGKGKEGVLLLQESVRANQEMGIERSCTILISGVPVCVHDSTWKECKYGHAPEDFVNQINEEYERLNALLV